METPSERTPTYTIAFYNLENLFDTVNDPKTLDDDFTETSEKRWTQERFQKKIKKLGRVIANIGFTTAFHPPVVVGVAEVENRTVLEALVGSKYLRDKNYKIVHFDSPDERGIDTALLYRSDYFTVLDSTVHTLYVENEFGIRDFTRDILHVTGILEKSTVHVLVNHWPSRRAGIQETANKRIAAAKRNKEIVSAIVAKDEAARIIIMGDFNDDPHSESIKELSAASFFNPMETLLTRTQGSLNYRGGWNLFDQILISHNFLKQYGNSFRFQEAHIYNPHNVRELDGRYKGNPFRTFVGRKYLGGISDHFPVYTTFTIHEN